MSAYRETHGFKPQLVESGVLRRDYTRPAERHCWFCMGRGEVETPDPAAMRYDVNPCGVCGGTGLSKSARGAT